MSQLLVRNLEKSLIRTLKIRAAENGHSAEEEHRIILRQALTRASGTESIPDLKEYLRNMPNVDLDLPIRNHSSERTLDL